MRVADTNVCVTKCAEEFGNPCTKFCPAGVYEVIACVADTTGNTTYRSVRMTIE